MRICKKITNSLAVSMRFVYNSLERAVNQAESSFNTL